MPRADDTVMSMMCHLSHPHGGHILSIGKYRPAHTLECRVPGAKLEGRLLDTESRVTPLFKIHPFCWSRESCFCCDLDGQRAGQSLPHGPRPFLTSTLLSRTEHLHKFCAISDFKVFKIQHISKAEKCTLLHFCFYFTRKEFPKIIYIYLSFKL